MAKKDPRIDAYIEKSREFARPILQHLRELVHQGCPEVQETLKWNMPAFEHKGLLCMMAAFKRHATFSIWKHELVLGKQTEKEAMGQFGRITSLQNLPPDEKLLAYIRKAARLNEAGAKVPSRLQPKSKPNRRLAVPGFLTAALQQNKKARQNFESFSFSHKREYVEWLTAAKREETRQKRLETALQWIAKGKPQNWRYMRA